MCSLRVILKSMKKVVSELTETLFFLNFFFKKSK